MHDFKISLAFTLFSHYSSLSILLELFPQLVLPLCQIKFTGHSTRLNYSPSLFLLKSSLHKDLPDLKGSSYHCCILVQNVQNLVSKDLIQILSATYYVLAMYVTLGKSHFLWPFLISKMKRGLNSASLVLSSSECWILCDLLNRKKSFHRSYLTLLCVIPICKGVLHI